MRVVLPRVVWVAACGFVVVVMVVVVVVVVVVAGAAGAAGGDPAGTPPGRQPLPPALAAAIDGCWAGWSAAGPKHDAGLQHMPVARL